MTNPEQLRERVCAAIRAACANGTGIVYVAYSGGLDSTVLLHLAQQTLRNTVLKAIHVDHGLHPDSANWASRCQANAQAIEVPLQVVAVDAQAPDGESPEAYARELRYQAFSKILSTDDRLLTAHHRDDDDETLLINLLRGAGPSGLSGVPETRALGAGTVSRPLLSFSREELSSIARDGGFTWQEDPSNTDTDIRRNHLRHEVMPALARTGAGYSSAFSRVRKLQAEAASNLAALAEIDLQAASTGIAWPAQLPVRTLSQLPGERRRNALYHWLAALKLNASWQLLEAIDELLEAKPDSHGGIPCEEFLVHRYQDVLYVEKNIEPALEALPWQPDTVLALPQGELLGVLAIGTGISKEFSERELRIDFRQDGEQIHLAGRDGTRSVSKLLQEARVPPWRRSALPMIFRDETLIAIPGIGVASEFAAEPGEAGVVPVFHFATDRNDEGPKR